MNDMILLKIGWKAKGGWASIKFCYDLEGTDCGEFD
jgi:hypothetical protein